MDDGDAGAALAHASVEKELGGGGHRGGEAALHHAGDVGYAERAGGRVEDGDEPAAVDDARPALQRRRRREAAAAVDLERRRGGERGGDRAQARARVLYSTRLMAAVIVTVRFPPSQRS
jgi:hypothetical protein